MLTARQKELLGFINGHIAQHGFSPSFREMKNAIGVKSTNSIYHLIIRLEERGFIRRLQDQARAIEVLRMPRMAAVAGTLAIPMHHCPQCDGHVFPSTPDKPICPRHGRTVSPVPQIGEAAA